MDPATVEQPQLRPKKSDYFGDKAARDLAAAAVAPLTDEQIATLAPAVTQPKTKVHEAKLSDDAATREAWLRTGDHEELKQTEAPPPRKLHAGEKSLEAMTDQEREQWLATSEMPERELFKPKEEKPEKSGEKSPDTASEEPKKHILTRLAVLGEQIDNVKHQEAVNSYADRFREDHKSSGATEADARVVLEAAKGILPQLPQRLTAFMEQAYPHLHHPFQFQRQFFTDLALRAKIVAEDARANSKGILRIMADVDRGLEGDEPFVPPKKRFTSAPGPGVRGAGGGKATAPVDPIRRALQEGNFEEYQKLENAREAESMRGGRY